MAHLPPASGGYGCDERSWQVFRSADRRARAVQQGTSAARLQQRRTAALDRERKFPFDHGLLGDAQNIKLHSHANFVRMAAEGNL